MSVYYKKLDLVQNTYYKSINLCNTLTNNSDSYYCKQSLNLVGNQIPSVQTKLESLKNLIGHTRQRRGWFNGIGSIFKTVFGTLDSNDAEYYEKAINQVADNEHTSLNLMKDQVHVIKSTIANFNETISQLKFHETHLNENINKINRFSEMAINSINALETKEIITQHIGLLSYLSNEINEEIDNLINAVLFARKNTLHPMVITPIQLVTELSNNVQFLPKGLKFPVPCNLENAHILFNIINLQVYLKNSNLVFILNLPLTEESYFTLYRLLPLPVPHDESSISYAYVQPSSNYLAISSNHMSYSVIHDINECKSLTNEHFLCKNNILYSTSQNTNCEISLFMKYAKTIPKNCNTKILFGNIEIIHALKFNKWILISSQNKPLTILCDHIKEIIDYNIVGTNLLTLNNTCEAYMNSNRLVPSYVVTTEFHSVIPSLNIVDDDCCKQTKLNFSHEYLQLSPLSLTNINLDSLKFVSHNLDKINKKIEEAEMHPNLIKYPSLYSLLMYVLSAIILLFIFYKIYQCSRFKKTNKNENCIIKITNKICSKSSNEIQPVSNYPSIVSVVEEVNQSDDRRVKHKSHSSLNDQDFNVIN